MTPDLSEEILSTDRLSVYCLRSRPVGQAQRVLLLGGSNFDLRLKRSFLDTDLVQHFDIATFEPRGIGRTDQPGGVWKMDDYARDAISAMDTMGWPDAALVGESFGGHDCPSYCVDCTGTHYKDGGCIGHRRRP